jgi:LmbE family N-acetylglucosaminyl deacetylase
MRVLCIGAHSDDIEIGCAGTLLRLQEAGVRCDITWVIGSGQLQRGREAKSSARALLRRAESLDVVLGDLPDTRFPAAFEAAKEFLASIRDRVSPELIFTHQLEDRHQDHRLIAELTWQTWRDHLILEYEIPKYEGDLGHPNFYVPLSRAQASRKVRHLMRHFGSQSSKGWFSEETFRSLMCIRGLECRAASGAAEAFHVRKAVL